MKNSPSTSEAALLAVSAVLSLAVSAAIFTGAATAEPAPAPQQHEKVEFKFTYDRADLSTRDGAAKVLARLESQASLECMGSGRTTIEERRIAQSCIASVMQNAISQMNSTTVAEAYAARNS